MIDPQRPGHAHPARPGRCLSPAPGAAAARPLPRVALPRPLRSAVAASALAFAAIACRQATDVPPPPNASPPALAPLPPGVAEALAAATAIPIVPPASAAVPFVLRPAAAPPSGEPALGAGPWSPDGTHLVAYTQESGAAGEAAIGRVWIVDAGAAVSAVDPAVAGVSPAPRWTADSGDVVGAVAERALATWQADGSLLLARDADPVIDAAGDVVPSAPPPRNGDLPADALAGIPVEVRPGIPADAWAWRSDGGPAAAVTASGSVWLFDPAADGPAREISRLVFEAGDAGADDAGDDEGAAGAGADAAAAAVRPIWLADGRLFVPRPARFGAGAGSNVVDYPLIDPLTLAIVPVTTWAGLAANPAMPPDGRALVAPDGRTVLVPLVVDEPGGPALAGTRVARIDGAPPKDIQPIGSPLWAPDSSAFAYPEAGALFVYDVASGLTRRLFDTGTRQAWWSPDSRQLAVATADGGLVLVERDGALAPTRVLNDLDGALPPSWAAAGRRLAAAARDVDGQPQLVIIDLPSARSIDRPIDLPAP